MDKCFCGSVKVGADWCQSVRTHGEHMPQRPAASAAYSLKFPIGDTNRKDGHNGDKEDRLH
jgi:hypothetical protein